MTTLNSGCWYRPRVQIQCASVICCLYFFSALALANNVDWPLHGGTSDEQRFSPLTQINQDNADQLGLAWSFQQFVVRGRTHRGNQATALVVDGTLFITGPWSVVYALDAKTGKLLWQYDPNVAGQWARKACCDVVNRGVAYWQDKIFVATLDGYLDRLNASTGKREWRVDTFIDRTRAYTITGAPRLAGNNIVIGNGGAELGVRGYVTAYNLKTGRQAWRFFTVPQQYANKDENSAMVLARTTWSKQSLWHYGLGGTVWDSMVYDPELNWIYIGVGNGSPWPAWQRSPGGGDNLFLSSIVALDATTGAMQWYYQTTPAESWDYTATQHMILTELLIGKQRRKVIMQAPKNGFFYVLDRVTGQLLSAKPYTNVNWALGIDPATGRAIINPQANYKTAATTVWPSITGGHNWQPMSYNPNNGLVYIPVLETPSEFIPSTQAQFFSDTVNVHAQVNANPQSDKVLDAVLGEIKKPLHRSVLKAWNPLTQSLAWQSSPQTWWSGGVLSSAGGVVFQGSVDGKFTIYNANTGRLLNSIETGSAIMAPPISYQIDGVQYVAVLAGFGGSLRTYPRLSAPLSYQNLERLLVFKLDGGPVPKPSLKQAVEQHKAHRQQTFDLAMAARGQQLFLDFCSRCHAYRGQPNNYPNLWNLPAAVYDSMNAFVLDGVLAGVGMPAFDDVLNAGDVAAIREFLLMDEAKAQKSRRFRR